MTKAQTILADDEISAILQQHIDQEKQSIGIVVGAKISPHQNSLFTNN